MHRIYMERRWQYYRLTQQEESRAWIVNKFSLILKIDNIEEAAMYIRLKVLVRIIGLAVLMLALSACHIFAGGGGGMGGGY